MADKYTDLYARVGALTSPWSAGNWRPDYRLLHRLIRQTVVTGKAFNPQTGALAAATNVWVATELRRAGVEPDRVWPRSTEPRTLAWDAAAAARHGKRRKQLPAAWGLSTALPDKDFQLLQQRTIEEFVAQIGRGPGIAPDPATGTWKNPANILGAHFTKEIDVSMARYDRGLELGVSTKTMIREPTKNIPNRREEASGDLLNIRRRFPLAAFGYFFLLEGTIADNPGHLAKVIDMCRKVALSTPGDEGTSYDASCLVIVDLQQTPPRVRIRKSDVPLDLSAETFFDVLIDRLMRRSQADDHRAARSAWIAAGKGP